MGKDARHRKAELLLSSAFACTVAAWSSSGLVDRGFCGRHDIPLLRTANPRLEPRQSKADLTSFCAEVGHMQRRVQKRL